MADTLSRLIDVAQNDPNPENRKRAVDYLTKIQSTKERLSRIAMDESAPGENRDKARSYLAKMGGMSIPTSLAGSIRSFDTSDANPSAPAPDTRTARQSMNETMARFRERAGGLRLDPELEDFNNAPEDVRRKAAGAVAGIGAGALTGGLAAMAIPTATAAGGALGGIAAAGAGGIAAGRAARAADAAASGESVGDAVFNTDGLALDAVLGSAPQAIGAAAGLGSRAIRGVSPWLNRLAEARKSGALDAAKKLPKGEAGIDAAIEAGKNQILNRDAELTQYGGALYRGGQEGIPDLNDLRPMDRLHANLDRLPRSYVASGEPINEGVQSVVDEVKRNTNGRIAQRIHPVRESDLQTNVRRVAGRTSGGEVDQTSLRYEPDPGRPGDKVVGFTRGETTREPMATKGDLLDQRRTLRDKAYNTTERTDANGKYRDAYKGVNFAIEQEVPEIVPLDKEWSKSRQMQKRARDILTRKEDGGRAADLPPPIGADEALAGEATPMAKQLRIGDDIAMRRTLGRVGDTNVPGREIAPGLEELAAMDPEYARALKFIEAKKALEGSRFSFRGALPENLAGATSHLVGVPLSLAKQNARAVGRIADPLMEAASKYLSVPELSLPGPVASALTRDRERAKKLRNRK